MPWRWGRYPSNTSQRIPLGQSAPTYPNVTHSEGCRGCPRRGVERQRRESRRLRAPPTDDGAGQRDHRVLPGAGAGGRGRLAGGVSATRPENPAATPSPRGSACFEAHPGPGVHQDARGVPPGPPSHQVVPEGLEPGDCRRVQAVGLVVGLIREPLLVDSGGAATAWERSMWKSTTFRSTWRTVVMMVGPPGAPKGQVELRVLPLAPEHQGRRHAGQREPSAGRWRWPRPAPARRRWAGPGPRRSRPSRRSSAPRSPAAITPAPKP